MKLHQPLILVLVLAATVRAGDGPPAREIHRLIDELDHPVYRIRLAAEQTLAGMGERAVPALRQALRRPVSLETERLRQLLLAPHDPVAYDAHFNGWHWVYSTIVHAQTFQ